jgi:streptogramin lyase
VWVPDVGNNGALPGITMIDPADGTQFATFQAPSLAAGAQSVGVDQSGNLWVLLNNETVTEYIGLATPAVAPLSVAVSKSKLGSEP